MHVNYKQGEFNLRNIIEKYTIVDQYMKFKFIIYYKEFKTANHIVNKSNLPARYELHRTKIIYEFLCHLRNNIVDENKFMSNNYIN